MKILIAYATTDGQTRKIARYCADYLVDHGHTVELITARDAAPLDLTRFDRAVLAGSIHAGGFQKDLHDLAEAHAAELSQKDAIFLAVSLTAAGTDADDWKGLRKCIARFEDETEWVPARVVHVAGAFRFSEYDFFRAWAMRRIAAERDETVDTHADKEYTDWDALAAEMDRLVA
ncbi:flavodoxin domain-containing protein [Octadecabacter sp. R77987]|uniref:flavodoxin domain-containing protein n=1 Tax=Octadecabacter sp. R77987 TaxID=3093874 RepID=UPI00366E341D